MHDPTGPHTGPENPSRTQAQILTALAALTSRIDLPQGRLVIEPDGTVDVGFHEFDFRTDSCAATADSVAQWMTALGLEGGAERCDHPSSVTPFYTETVSGEWNGGPVRVRAFYRLAIPGNGAAA